MKRQGHPCPVLMTFIEYHTCTIAVAPRICNQNSAEGVPVTQPCDDRSCVFCRHDVEAWAKGMHDGARIYIEY